MMYLGDYEIDFTGLHFKFLTETAAKVPTTLAGTPVLSVYKSDSDAQSTAGITLTEDFDGLTGLNHVVIDLSSDAFYIANSEYQIVITTGTVDSISVVGTVVATFSIENRAVAGAKAVWDRVLNGSTHNIPVSAGRRLRGIQEFQGYEGGAVWINTLNGNSGTVNFENGTVENPVDNLADANSIATSLNISIFHTLPGSSLIFTTVQNDQFFTGVNWSLALGNQDISGSMIHGADVTGTVSGIGTTQVFRDCTLNAVTHLKNTHAMNCSIAGIQTVFETGDYFFDNCHSGIAGISTPTFDFNASVGSVNLNMRHYSGGIQIENMGDLGTDTMSLEGFGQFIEGTCTGGIVAIRGNFTTSGITNLTLIDDARYDIQQTSNAVWNELLTGSTHNINNSAGKRLRSLASVVVRNEFAQGSGVGNNQIQLDTGASTIDGGYDPALVAIISGTGTGQMRLILQYDGTTKIATVDRNWKVNPDATSEFNIIADAGREHVNEGLAQAGTSITITLNILASSDDDTYRHQIIFIRSGTGEDQARSVTNYNGTTKVATVNKAWDVIPNTTSAYVMLPASLAPIEEVAAAVWNALTVGHIASGSFGERMFLIEAILKNRTETDSSTGVMTVYAVDDTTPLLTANIFEDVAGVTAYNAASTRVDRKDRLT